MRLGILSDTHDHRPSMQYAIQALQQRGAGFIIHCGDICSPDLLDCLTGQPAGFVWGNSDPDHPSLHQRAKALGIHCFGDFEEIDALGQKLAVIHGDDKGRMQTILNEQRYDYLLCGHTHVWRDERVGRTRIINPGALKNTKGNANELTCALLDLRNGQLEKITIG